MEECYQSDIKVSLGLMSYVDFREGVRALTVDKDNNPRWQHQSIFDITEEELEFFF